MGMDGLDDHEPCTQRLLPRPDISQMIPFKPKRDPYPGEHPVPGESVQYITINIILLVLFEVLCIYFY